MRCQQLWRCRLSSTLRQPTRSSSPNCGIFISHQRKSWSSLGMRVKPLSFMCATASPVLQPFCSMVAIILPITCIHDIWAVSQVSCFGGHDSPSLDGFQWCSAEGVHSCRVNGERQCCISPFLQGFCFLLLYGTIVPTSAHHDLAGTVHSH